MKLQPYLVRGKKEGGEGVDRKDREEEAIKNFPWAGHRTSDVLSQVTVATTL